jgi:hypothetical protein
MVVLAMSGIAGIWRKLGKWSVPRNVLPLALGWKKVGEGVDLGNEAGVLKFLVSFG